MAKEKIIYQMRVDQIIDHTPSVRELVLKTLQPEKFKFAAGQFVMLHVPQASKPALRAYSIASDDRIEDGFRLLFKYVESGLASEFVWKLQGGETLQLTGPFGRMFFKEPPSSQIIMLNTGTGVSQHISYLLSKRAKFPNLRYRMLFGVRSENEIYYREPLEQLTRELADFRFEYVLSRPSGAWTGKSGYVQKYMDEFQYRELDSTFYLCGNGNMIKEVKTKLIEQQGFDKTKIFAEAFD